MLVILVAVKFVFDTTLPSPSLLSRTHTSNSTLYTQQCCHGCVAESVIHQRSNNEPVLLMTLNLILNLTCVFNTLVTETQLT